MTSKPASCTPQDTVDKAAQLMKSKDVGPIPVVSDDEKRVVGIVTDRDLTIKVLAEGRDPKATLVDDVMTRYPICCRENDDLNSALRAMSMHQVRRVPVVDKNYRLLGIISQADVARHLGDEKTAAVVEDISERGGSGDNWSAYEGKSAKSGPGALTAAIAGASVALGLMYLLDPAQGESRRAEIREKASKMIEQFS